MSAVNNKTAKSPSGLGNWKVKDFFKDIMKKPSPNPPTLRQESFIEKYAHVLYILLAFLIPFLLMFFAFKVMGVSPYGDKQILVTDLWHQYYPFIVDYQAKLKAGESLLWSWTSGGGTNYVALIAYYLASPLNFLSVLVPADSLREFLFVITCVKIGCAGMFFSLFLRITFKRRDISITAFGVMYALCAFIMGYYWNIIWLDSVAMLPLVIAGAFALLRDGRFKLYIISLALSILANYYIGLFVCAAVLLCAVGYSIVELKGWKKLVRDFFKMAGCSIVAIMMTAMLTLPAYFALGHAYSSSNSFPEKFAVNIASTPDFGGVLEGICKTISNSVAFVQPTAKEGLPNVYTGVITIFLAILFFFCSKIKRRERIFCGVLALFFLTSFVIRQLDYIWHGFHFPNMLPYRFSFLYSFLLIYMAFRVFMYIDYVKIASVIGAICGFLVYLYIAGIYFDDANVNLTTMFATVPEGEKQADPILLSGWIGMILAAWILLYALRERLPRLFTAVGAVGIGIATVVFILDLYKKLDVSALKSQPAEVVDGAAPAADNIPTILTIVLVVLIAVIAVILLSRLNADNAALKTIVSVVLVLLALFEGLFSAATGVRTVSVTDATSYPLGTTSSAEAAAYVRELEKDNVDIARAETTRYHTLNDNALLGINGISMFNSMVNMPITNYMEKFGICGWIASNRYTYMESSPFTDLMLNLKYLIDPYYGSYRDTIHYEKIYTANAPKSGGNPAIVMQNRYYLPMGFMVNADLLRYKANDPVGFINKIGKTNFTADYVAATDNPVENQNNFFRLSTGIDSDLYIPQQVTLTEGGTADDEINLTSGDQYAFSSKNSNSSYKLSANASATGTALAYVTGSGVEDVSLHVNDTYLGHFGTKRPLIMMIGDVKKGDKITAEPKVTNSSSGSITCDIIILNEEMFRRAYQQFSRSVLDAEVVSGTRLSGTINAVEDGLFYTSIPYVTGWRAFVDGEEVEITPVGDAMLAFKLSAGEHTIDLRYSPEGFKLGIIVSVLGLVIFILMILAVWQKKRLLPVWRRVTGKAKGALPKKLKPAAPDATAVAESDDSALPSETDENIFPEDEPSGEPDVIAEEPDGDSVT